MLRLSKIADYAVVVLVQLAESDRVQTSGTIAARTGVPEPTVAKVLKLLAGADLAVSQRGARGGYRLSRPLDTIAVGDVIRAVEGPVFVTACVEGSAIDCDSSRSCPINGRWQKVNQAIEATLAAITLADVQSSSPFGVDRQSSRTGTAEPAIR
jgi:FeS assembly SUF system regulator